jgi:hypothetical protein
MNTVALFVIVIPVVIAISCFLVHAYITRPRPSSIGSILNRLRVIDFLKLRNEQDTQRLDQLPPPLKRQARRNQSLVVAGSTSDIANNLRYLHKFLVFENTRTPVDKSSLDYTPFEYLVDKLATDAESLRWLIFRFRLLRLLRAILFNWETFRLSGKHILYAYKDFESAVVALVQMGQSDIYYSMLCDRLGLRWDIVEKADSGYVS